MKKFFALTLLLFASLFASHAYAEVFKLRAYSASMRSTDRYGNWSDWTDWSDCNILVSKYIVKKLKNMISFLLRKFAIQKV